MRNPRRRTRDQFDDPLHRAKLEHTIAVSRITGAVVASGVVFATDMPENLVNEIDARILWMIPEDAFYAVPMAMKHEPRVGDLHDLTQPLAKTRLALVDLRPSRFRATWGNNCPPPAATTDFQ